MQKIVHLKISASGKVHISITSHKFRKNSLFMKKKIFEENLYFNNYLRKIANFADFQQNNVFVRKIHAFKKYQLIKKLMFQ